MLVGTAAAKPQNPDVKQMPFIYTVLGPAMLLGLINFALVVFIDFCFNEGNILDWYYSLLISRVQPRSPKLAKVLGMCPVCMGFWVGLAVYAMHWKYLGLHPIGFIAFTAVSQYLLIKKFTHD